MFIKIILILMLVLPLYGNCEVIYNYEKSGGDNPFQVIEEKKLYRYEILHQDPAFMVKQLKKLFPAGKFILYENNSLIGIYATKSEYMVVKNFIDEFDCEVGQVRIEVDVIELTRDELDEFGISWTTEHGIDKQNRLHVLSDSGMLARVKAARQNGRAKIKANPSLVVKNNCSAVVKVGDKVPYATRVSDSGGITYSVSFLDAGLCLEINPRIVSGNYVHTIVDSKVSSIKGWKSTSAGEYPIISTKEAKTEVTVLSDQMFIIAGLKNGNQNNYTYEVPLLASIPFIGGLFRFSMSDQSETEIVFCIRPVII